MVVMHLHLESIHCQAWRSPTDEQEELIDLQCDEGIQEKFKNHKMVEFRFFFFFFFLPYLSSIHEKANRIAILWTVSPHSLGSCLFRGLWVTCLPHKGGAFR